MRRINPRPVKVFVTTENGATTYLVSDTDLLSAVQPFIRKYRAKGYVQVIEAFRHNKACFILRNSRTEDAVMVTGCRLYKPA